MQHFPAKKVRGWPFYKYVLTEDWTYGIRGRQRTLPKGWTFDGATFGWLIDLRKEASKAPAAIHDDLYENRGRIRVWDDKDEFSYIRVTKEKADSLFLDMIGDDGVNAKSWQRWLIKVAFKTVGHVFWIA